VALSNISTGSSLVRSQYEGAISRGAGLFFLGAIGHEIGAVALTGVVGSVLMKVKGDLSSQLSPEKGTGSTMKKPGRFSQFTTSDIFATAVRCLLVRVCLLWVAVKNVFAFKLSYDVDYFSRNFSLSI
jgi:hypothetical protein